MSLKSNNIYNNMCLQFPIVDGCYHPLLNEKGVSLASFLEENEFKKTVEAGATKKVNFVTYRNEKIDFNVSWRLESEWAGKKYNAYVNMNN